MTRALMLQGTGSDVGKTVLTAGLCRLALRQGLSVRPFKPQNMSNNAAVATIPETGGEGEIGRAQWLQALACRTDATVHMNPVLLKPQSETGSQIIVHGKVWGHAKGRDYQSLKPQLLEKVLESWRRLKAEADLVIVEGAGSPAEINLRAGDIANMGFARAAKVPVVLVGDIDRGGVIASIVGTHAILDPGDRDMIGGYIINKFRGDISLFDGARREIERFTQWPCLGVVPWLDAASRLPAEDSVALERLARASRPNGGIKVAVPVLGRIANFDDIDPLKNDPAYDVHFVRAGEKLPRDARMVIIPGSKSTIADIEGFRANGWDRDLHELRSAGAEIIGLCGGYQMLGKTVRDPLGIEGKAAETEGLGLLDIETVMEAEKTVRNVMAFAPLQNREIAGYEIHLGASSGPDCARPVAIIGTRPDGATSADGKVWGTYLHGVLDGLLSTGGAHAAADRALDEIADRLEMVLEKDLIARFAS
jgi:adenosylcobyric acid synthase